jgi:PAS domain S-box-containing protein
MTERQVDFEAVFQSLPTPVLLMTPDLLIVDMNRGYERNCGRTREELIGRLLFDAFPDNPSEPASTGSSNLAESLRKVVATREKDVMALQRYDVEIAGSVGKFEERYWCPVNVPVLDADGNVALVLHAVEEVSGLIRKFVEAEAANA